MAQIFSTGEVKGIAAGTATITATSEGEAGQILITVVLPPVATVFLSPAETVVKTGDSILMLASLEDDRREVLSRSTTVVDNVRWITRRQARFARSICGSSARLAGNDPSKKGPFMKRIMQHILLLSLALSFTSNPAFGAVISTEAALAVHQRADSIVRISGVMMREDVRSALVQMGVDPDQAVKRVNALTLTELAELENQLEKLPAGGVGVVEVLGIVAVVLIVLELLGVTNVFTKF